MEYILINSLGDYPEDFLFAKVDVEKKLIEDEKIDKRMRLEDFVLFLNIQNTVFMNDQKGIAFSIQKGLDNDYVFYNFLDNEDTDNTLSLFKKRLENMNYDLSKVRKLEPMELIQPDVLNGDLFLINFEICKP